MSQFFEIVIFTSQTSMVSICTALECVCVNCTELTYNSVPLFKNAMPILEKLDPYQYSMYRLYREATRYVDGKYVKDLSHLNRDLSKVIIMDSNPEAFSMQPENGIELKPFKGDPNDNGLLSYIPFLEGNA